MLTHCIVNGLIHGWLLGGGFLNMEQLHQRLDSSTLEMGERGGEIPLRIHINSCSAYLIKISSHKYPILER